MRFSFERSWRDWQSYLGNLLPYRPRQRRRKLPRPGVPLHLEVLEDRTAPAVYNVPNGTEPGINIGSLNAAIQLADTNSDTTNIINLCQALTPLRTSRL